MPKVSFEPSFINMDLLKALQENPSLQGVSDDQLQWLIDNSERRDFREGEFLFKKGEPTDHMMIVLSGKARAYSTQNNQKRELFELEPPDISGLLPFSRLKTAIGSAEVMQPTTVLLTSREKLKELVCTHYDLTEKLVQQMTSRVREFTSMQRQNEKMMALGKLSAGLAHELNNPAAAIVRSSDELKKHLAYTPERFKQVISMKLEEEQVDAVNAILYEKAKAGRQSLGLRERNKQEEDILDWFDDNDLKGGDDLAENFIEYGIGPKELDMVREYIPEKELLPVLFWLDNVLTTERMVGDINEASTRISKLVQSVKSYSHMDRGHDKAPTNIHIGIKDTLTMLDHKIRKANISLAIDVASGIPPINLLAGEMNQVWTNIIDNAIDALEGVPSPMLTVKSVKDGEFVKVHIIDNGPGIPPDLLGKIFDPFFTTKEVGKGSGLGLEIAKNIVEQHNGTLKATSRPGETIFTVCIPLKDK
ncbi:ATP-binding protein [uncultured Imperialibacter sp.]|uniref:ATP-binding protein n=1 Tax=uncultured Imperialibacter sp. TaxID=1672639 RepID=UPI0030D86CE6|tara:strand:+ start:110137 stop:111567 length:1431 start_codon:yes stop_codon:yes gene_type:complete